MKQVIQSLQKQIFITKKLEKVSNSNQSTIVIKRAFKKDNIYLSSAMLMAACVGIHGQAFAAEALSDAQLNQSYASITPVLLAEDRSEEENCNQTKNKQADDERTGKGCASGVTASGGNAKSNRSNTSKNNNAVNQENANTLANAGGSEREGDNTSSQTAVKTDATATNASNGNAVGSNTNSTNDGNTYNANGSQNQVASGDGGNVTASSRFNSSDLSNSYDLSNTTAQGVRQDMGVTPNSTNQMVNSANSPFGNNPSDNFAKQIAENAVQNAKDNLLNPNKESLSGADASEFLKQQLTQGSNNTGTNGATLTISVKDVLKTDYFYRSINGGGINKGTDIEIPSIETGNMQIQISTK